MKHLRISFNGLVKLGPFALFIPVKPNFELLCTSIIYLSRVLCLCVCVCVSQFVAERSAILLVLVIKLTKETETEGFKREGLKMER